MVEPRSGAFRPEIQALRALAVTLVVVFHLFPRVLPGGYVGVDVFFVISGFLITGQLGRELERTGRIRLGRFWARRARRLLPASFAVLVACAIATLALVPMIEWRQFLGEIRASALYVENWHLAAAAVDYQSSDAPPSPVKHYWSLSAEEQFYVVWPLLMIVAALLARRLRSTRLRAPVAWTLALAAALSLGAALVLVAATPTSAYYLSVTRAWEFAAGGLLALAGDRLQIASGGRAALSWAGLAAIGGAAVAYGPGTRIPGWPALVPVLGAVAVIAAGLPRGRLSSRSLLVPAPVQFLGDVSYSAYLWHWPLIVFAPYALSAAGTTDRIAILGLTVLAAWLSKTCIEDPYRRGGRLGRVPPRTILAAAAAVTAAALALPLAGLWRVQQEISEAQTAAQHVLSKRPACFGAAARDLARRPCLHGPAVTTVVPEPLAATAEPNAACHERRREPPITTCGFGMLRGRPTIALVGDSHASHWRGALDDAARRLGWRGVSVTHTGCAFSHAIKRADPARRAACRAWNNAVPRWLERHPGIHTVFVSGITGGAVAAAPGRTRFATEVMGYRAAWAELPASVHRIVVLRDTPRVPTVTAGCVQDAMNSRRLAGPACAVPRAVALQPDPAVAAARAPGTGRTTAVVDLTRTICDTKRCFPVVGGALVFKDTHHLTATFSRSLGPQLSRRLRSLERH